MIFGIFPFSECHVPKPNDGIWNEEFSLRSRDILSFG